MDRSRTLAALSFCTLVGFASAALAVDGVIEINQAAVAAGGITPGDTAGFPATLKLPGSYRLTGNLDVRLEQNPQNVVAISVAADNVTVDLNGFAIIGPVVCSGSPFVCMPSGGTGSAVQSTRTHTSVVNGTVDGMGGNGVHLTSGSGGRVDAVRAVSNGSIGIVATNGSVTGCISLFNGGAGISADGSVVTKNNARRNIGTGIAAAAATVSGNVASENGGHGISGLGSVVLGNVASSNVGFGLAGDNGTGYGTNVFNGNNSNGPQVVGGPNQIVVGSNVCGTDTVCP